MTNGKKPPAGRTRIFVNACTLRVAGGLSIGINFLKTCYENPNLNFEITAVVPPGLGYEKYQSDRITVIPIPKILSKAIFRLVLDFIWLPNKIRKSKPQAIFSMGNIALPIRSIPQALFLHWPYAVYLKGPFWDSMPWIPKLLRNIRVAQFKFFLPYADFVFVQGEHMQKRLCEIYHIPKEKTLVVPSSIDSRLNPDAKPLPIQFPKEYLTVGFLSRYYSHKNFDLLLQCAELIKTKQLQIAILITLSPNHGPEAQHFISKIKAKELSDILINLGPIPFEQVSSFYNTIDALVFPSLVETFGLPQVEAMKFGKPVLAADLDYAHEISEDAAVYFNPRSAEDLLSKLIWLQNHPEELKNLSQKSKKRLLHFPSWETINNTYLEQLERLAHSHDVG